MPIVKLISSFTLGGAITKGLEAIGTIKAKFFAGDQAAAPPPTKVDVGVSVGLDKGLTETNKAVTTTGNRRPDVGVAAA